MIGVLLLFYAVFTTGTIGLRFRRWIVLYVIVLLNLLMRVELHVTVDHVAILLTLASISSPTVMVTFAGLRRLVCASAATVRVMITS